ncbi:hypothetical protein CKA32_002788 [Geitlerinema sp. FC II]|nr:hypothetical protein CKA32_002788 [Geitlerinema sp. FC II]
MALNIASLPSLAFSSLVRRESDGTSTVLFLSIVQLKIRFDRPSKTPTPS